MSKAELEIARIVWELKDAGVRQVFEALPPGRDIDFTTVQTYLRRLEEKGYLNARLEGRNRVYSPKVRPQTVIRETVGEMVDLLFGSETLPLMRHRVEDRKFSRDDIDQGQVDETTVVPWMVIATYAVADLIVPQPIAEASLTTMPPHVKADFAPLMELIIATVEPDSWRPDCAVVVENEDTQSLVIRQTQRAHDNIQKLLTQLRPAEGQDIRIQSMLLKLTDDGQMAWLDVNCSLHQLENGNRWALLPQQRSEPFIQTFLDLSPEVISRPQILTISGQAAMIQVGGITETDDVASGFRLSMTPRLVPDSQIIRLQNSFRVGSFNSKMPSPVESLVGSGQTLLLLVTDQDATTNARPNPSHYLLMMTPEYLQLQEEAESLL